MSGRGKREGLPVVSSCRRDYAADPGLARHQAADVVQRPPDLECADSGVVLVLDPELTARAQIKERPGKLRRRRDDRVNAGGYRLNLGKRWERRHFTKGLPHSRPTTSSGIVRAIPRSDS